MKYMKHTRSYLKSHFFLPEPAERGRGPDRVFNTLPQHSLGSELRQRSGAEHPTGCLMPRLSIRLAQNRGSKARPRYPTVAARHSEFQDILTFETSSRKKPFTLIELLVVFSIIIILVAILLPALSSAKKAGEKIFCANNQRQLCIALNTYISDNNGWIGHCHDHGAKSGSYLRWAYKAEGIFGPYLSGVDKNNLFEVSKCPSRHPNQSFHSFDPYGIGANILVMSDIWYSPYHMVQKCRKPSKTMVFGDCGSTRGSSCAWMDPIAYGYDLNASERSAKFSRHFKRGNFVMLDGHLESLDLQKALGDGFAATASYYWGATWGFLPPGGY